MLIRKALNRACFVILEPIVVLLALQIPVRVYFAL